jgi:hypothetical protein
LQEWNIEEMGGIFFMKAKSKFLAKYFGPMPHSILPISYCKFK